MFEDLMSTTPYRILFLRAPDDGTGTGADIDAMQDGSVQGAAAALATMTLDDEADDDAGNDDGQQDNNDGQQGADDDGQNDDGAQSDDGDGAQAQSDGDTGQGEGDEQDWFELPPEKEGGEPVRVAATEVWEGYQKSQELAEENAKLKERDSQIPAEVDTALKETIETRQQLAASLQTWKELQAPPAPDPDMLTADSPKFDPQGYKEALERSNAFAAAQAEAEKELAKQQEAMQKEMDIRNQVAIGRANAEIKTFWPEFVDDKAVKTAAHNDMVQLFGATAEEMENTYDPRFWKMAKAAIAHEKAKAATKRNVTIVRGKPKLVKGKARDSNSGKRTSRDNAMASLLKDGNNEAAAVAALETFDDI